MEESPRVLQHVEQRGYQSITEMVAALGGNAEHARLVCFDLFEQGQLQRHQRRTGKRGRPEYLYGVGDFSHVTHTTPPGAENEPRTITAKQTVENVAANTTNISKRQTGHLSRHDVRS